MPTRNEIQNEIIEAKNISQDNIRRKYIKKLSSYTKRDTIIYMTAYTTNKMSIISPASVQIVGGDIHGFMSALNNLKNENLDLIIHSPGGSAEAAEQIVNYLRSKYKHIRAIVPQNAMSAATMIACACDEIIMGKHSAIGPIDPQITFPTTTGFFTAPAHSLLKEFEQAKNEIQNNPSSAPIWVSKLQTLPHGILNICDNTIKRSINLVKNWLTSYMFKDDEDRENKSDSIASWLGAADTHKSHGRPIPLEECVNKGLKIVKLEDDQQLQEKILSVFHSSIVTIEITNCVKFIENQNGKGIYIQMNGK